MITFAPREFIDVTYPFCYKDGLFNSNELDAIVDYGTSLNLEKGIVVGPGGSSTESDVRHSSIKFIQPNSNNLWIFEKLAQGMDELNRRYYNFDLAGFDAIQYTEYNSQGHKYDWHMDTILGTDRNETMCATRKLTGILFLADPAEYEGGEFQLQTGMPDNPLVIEQTKGRLVVFPSFLIHRVTPIVRGIRKSLVAWNVGPKFK